MIFVLLLIITSIMSRNLACSINDLEIEPFVVYFDDLVIINFLAFLRRDEWLSKNFPICYAN